MICLCLETHLSSLTVILYTCLIIPLLHLSHAISKLVRFMVDPHNGILDSSTEGQEWEIDLPVCQFQDLRRANEEEICAICLGEFQGEDVVNRVPRCGHVFHMGCLEDWLDRCQFTCPLCRASVLQPRPCLPSSNSSCSSKWGCALVPALHS